MKKKKIFMGLLFLFIWIVISIGLIIGFDGGGSSFPDLSTCF